MKNKGEIIVYQSENTLQLEVRMENETVWLTQAQMVELFQRDRTVITKHINNVFREGELDKESNVHFLHIANSDKPIMLYSLDVIISVGYRVKSHDRFLIIDEKELYHIGASLKDLGKKWFAFSKIQLDIKDILQHL